MKTSGKNKKVVLGLSGGVDSAVAAYLLKEQGYEVFGVYLKNWTEKDKKGVCPAERDREDAMRAAAKLGIAFTTVDHEKEYRERVFAYLLKGLERGVNPNPDILCNPLVKFEALSAVADEIDAAWIATGHYARKVLDSSSPRSNNNDPVSSGVEKHFRLAEGLDKEKDQSYFLAMITDEQLERSIFPVGDLTKKEVRELAARIGLHLADKESTSGICFIGERKFEEFMKDHVKAEPGPVIDTAGRPMGEHRGLPFYTIGQRHGFGCLSTSLETADGAAGGQPYYVAEKRLKTNTIVVALAYDPALFRDKVEAIEPHWIGSVLKLPMKCEARIRYRQPRQKCKVSVSADDKLTIDFDEGQKAVTPGQYAVFYDGEICLGSALII